MSPCVAKHKQAGEPQANWQSRKYWWTVVFFSPPAGLAVLSHTLTPRMKASHIALQTMRGHLDAVYDVTVAYEGSLDSSRHRKPAPSMPGEHKHANHFSVIKPGRRPAVIIILFFLRTVILRRSLPSCFSLTGQLKTFLPIHDSFPVIFIRS